MTPQQDVQASCWGVLKPALCRVGEPSGAAQHLTGTNGWTKMRLIEPPQQGRLIFLAAGRISETLGSTLRKGTHHGHHL